MSDFFDHLEALDGTWEDREASSKLASFLTNAKYELDQKIGTFLSLAQTEEEFEARWGLCSIDLASVTAGLDEDSIGTLKESMKAQWFRPSGAKAKAKPAKVQASVQKTSLSFEEFKSETQKLMVAELTDSEMYDLYDSGLTPEDAASFSENSMPQGGYDPTNPDMPFQEDHEDLPSWTSSKLGSEDEDEEEAKDLGERYHQQATSKKASTGRTAAHLVVKPFMADDEDFPSPGDAGLQYETWDYDEDQDAYFVRGVDPDEESEWIEFFEGDHAFGNTEMVRIGSTRRTALRWEEPSYSTPDFPQWQGFDEQGQMVAEVTPYEDMDHGYGQVFEFAIYKDGVDPYTQDEGDHPTAQRAMEAADRWWSQNVGGTFSSKSPRGRRPFGDQKTASDQGRLVRDVDSAASDGSVVTLKSGTPVEVVQDDGNGLVVMVADSEAVQPEYFTEEFGVEYNQVRLASARTAGQWVGLQTPSPFQIDRSQPLSERQDEDWSAQTFLVQYDNLSGTARVLYQIAEDPNSPTVEEEGEVEADTLTQAIQKAQQEADEFLQAYSRVESRSRLPFEKRADANEIKNLSYHNRVKRGQNVRFPQPTIVRVSVGDGWGDRVVEPSEIIEVISETNAGFRGIEFSGRLPDGEQFYNLSTGFLDKKFKDPTVAKTFPEMEAKTASVATSFMVGDDVMTPTGVAKVIDHDSDAVVVEYSNGEEAFWHPEELAPMAEYLSDPSKYLARKNLKALVGNFWGNAKSDAEDIYESIIQGGLVYIFDSNESTSTRDNVVRKRVEGFQEEVGVEYSQQEKDQVFREVIDIGVGQAKKHEEENQRLWDEYRRNVGSSQPRSFQDIKRGDKVLIKEDGEVVPFKVESVRQGRLYGRTDRPESVGQGPWLETYWDDGVMESDWVPSFY